MSKRRFNGSEFIKELVNKKGYVRHDVNGQIIFKPPGDNEAKIKRYKPPKRTYDTNDHINIKNNGYDEFKRYLQEKTGIDVWIEFQFCKERRFRIDYAFPSIKLAIEIDGGIWMRGKSGHSSGSGIKRDQEKTTLLSRHGWKVIRVIPSEKYSDYLMDNIFNIIKGGY